MASSRLDSRFASIWILILISCCCLQDSTALHCGWPGKPVGGILINPSIPVPIRDDLPYGRASYVPDNNRLISYDYQFEEGQVVAYQCRTERQDIIRVDRGSQFNRTCQSDGRWSGTRPWCDLNVAYGRTVNYAGISNTISDTLMTDGLTNSEDPSNTAECSSLTKAGNAFLSIDFGDNLPVRVVGIFGKGGEGMNNLEGKKVSLGTRDCPQNVANSSAFSYECNRGQSQMNAADFRANTVKFEHTSKFVVDICEVVVYSNPTLAFCGEPEIPAFGEVTITTVSDYQLATYNCRNGYELQGNSNTSICRGRSWEGEQPLCVEQLSTTTTTPIRDLTDPYVGGNVSGGMDPFQIVLIVVCVALAIGLIVALFVLLKYGRLTCCGTASSSISRKLSSKKKTPPSNQGDYQKVTATNPYPVQVATPTTISSEEEARKRTAALAAAEQERQAKEQEVVYTKLAYQDERAPKTAPKPTTTPVVYAELNHEPVKRLPSNSGSEPSPVYAQVYMRTNKNDDQEEPKLTETPPVRKSYIPTVYLKESPEIQMKQQALNDQLKQAVKISRNTDF